MAKVKCGVCNNEVQGFCKIKKTTVKANKSRACSMFVYDVSKIKIREALPSSMRPDWYHDRKAFINRIKKDMKLQAKLQEEKVISENYMSSILAGQTDFSHPLTGDLSKFTTTAEKGK